MTTLEDKRVVGALKIAFCWLTTGAAFATFFVAMEDFFAPALEVAVVFGAFAFVYAMAAGIDNALKKRMDAEDYAAWQVDALKKEGFASMMMLSAAMAISGVGFWASFSLAAMILFIPVVSYAYIAAGMKLNSVLKKRMGAEDYAAWMKKVSRREIVLNCLALLAFFVVAVAIFEDFSSIGEFLMNEFRITLLLMMAAATAAVILLRAVLKKTMTADAFSTLPPMLFFALMIALAIVIIFIKKEMVV